MIRAALAIAVAAVASMAVSGVAKAMPIAPLPEAATTSPTLFQPATTADIITDTAGMVTTTVIDSIGMGVTIIADNDVSIRCDRVDR
jgi:hypothetical protein